MSQHDLELAWLSAIWEDQPKCRQVGLRGLDSSFFEDTELFEIGLLILRIDDFAPENTPDELLKRMAKRGLISKLERFRTQMCFLPCFYQAYCEVLEQRKQPELTPKWVKPISNQNGNASHSNGMAPR